MKGGGGYDGAEEDVMEEVGRSRKYLLGHIGGGNLRYRIFRVLCRSDLHRKATLP